MADTRPPYRPRRAFAADEQTPDRPGDDSPSSGGPTSDPTGAHGSSVAGAKGAKAEKGDKADKGDKGDKGGQSDKGGKSGWFGRGSKRGREDAGATAGPALSGRFTEDEARPIFREAAADADAATVRTPVSDTDAAADAAPLAGSRPPAGAAPTAEAPETPDGTGTETARTSRLNFTPRARPVEDDEATTLLPRTAGGRGEGRTPDARDVDDVDELDDRPRRLGRRTRLALLIGAVAAVVVVGLAIMYAVVGVRDQPGANSGTGVTGGPGTGATSAAGTPSAAALLDDTSMLAPAAARTIDPKRTWAVGATVRGPVPEGSGPGCLGSDPLEGAPTAQQTITRTLTGSGSGAPGALHVAQAYATAEDATQAFAATSRALGSCTVKGDWLFGGRVITGVGDQATAVAVRSVVGGRATQHWVVASRTGRALDIVDASTPGKSALDVDSVTKGLASVVGAQCGPAGGTCPAAVSTKDGPPPVGGDEPGFLAVGDLPPVGSTTAPWVGTPVEPPTEDFTGSQCESVTWATTPAATRSSRVYLLQDVPGIFGLNQITLTTKDAATASKLVEKVRSDWGSCKERKLTATVAAPTKVTGIGAEGTSITGYTTVVEQKAGTTTTRFRVGIASSGNKVSFVFLNPQKGLDVDGGAWNVVAVRAVQRQTQQS